MPDPRISQPGEGRHIRIFGGVEFFVKVGSEESGGGFAPRDIPHSFKVLSSTPGRALVLTIPGGFDKCVEELSRLPLDPPDMLTVFQVCARYGIEFLPAPAG